MSVVDFGIGFPLAGQKGVVRTTDNLRFKERRQGGRLVGQIVDGQVAAKMGPHKIGNFDVDLDLVVLAVAALNSLVHGA